MTISRFSYLSAKEATALEAAVADLIEQARIYRSCVTCQHFTDATERCGLAESRPPARIIATGCSSYFEVPTF